MVIRFTKKLMKSTWYPQPHKINGGCAFEADDATLDSTIIPVCFYDEGLGAPTGKETNPRNSAFAIVAGEGNCFVGSRVNDINGILRFSLSSLFNDSNLPSLRFAWMPIYMAFKENYTAIDELSSLEVQDILELQTESTDRQGGALYVAAKDLPEKATGDAVVGTNTPFLDTDTGLESVAFEQGTYYDMLHFLTNGSLLAKSSGGLRWITLTRDRPTKTVRFNIKPKVKRMNEFTYCGILLHVPLAGTFDQNFAVAEIAGAVNLLYADWHIRYNEWNEDFNSRML